MASLDDNLSDASLIEDEDDDASKMETDDDEDDSSNSESDFVIDLPGVPVTGAVDDATISSIEAEVRHSPPKKRPETAATEPDFTSPVSKKTRVDDIVDPFYGFLPSEIQKRVVIFPYDDPDADLKSPFDKDLLNTGGDLTTEDISELAPKSKPVTQSSPKPATPSTVVKRPPPPPSIIVPMSAITSPPSKATLETVPKVTPEPKKPMPALKPLPSPVTRETREWKPSAQFFKPLVAGWVREVIFERDETGNFCDKPKEIFYHSPNISGAKPRKFKSLAELGSYISSNVSEFTLNNFSFRKELMNAPKDQEISRAVDEEVEIFPPKPAAPITPNANVRRKSIPNNETPPQPIQKVTTAASTGLLKVKIFSRMKEKNIVTSPKDSGKDADENFDLVPTTPTASTTIFEKSGMKLKISTPTSAAFQMASPVSAVSTLASPTVTITPAVPNSQSLLLDKSKTPPGGFIRKVTTPQQHQQQQRRPSTGVKPTQQPQSKSRILRPPKMTPISCSVLCPNFTDYPDLSCVGCQVLFHPKCVGLSDEINYSSYEFYCYACVPPAGKENSEPPFKKSTTVSVAQVSGKVKSMTSQDIVSSLTSSSLTPTTTMPISNLAPSPRATTSATPISGKMLARFKTPLKALELQTVINIGGIKYLVVPAPPPTIQGQGQRPGSVNQQQVLKLKPSDGSENAPTFEVRESSDGKLILTKVPSKAKAQPLKKLFDGEKPKSNGTSQFAGVNLLQEMSNANSALVHVFKYLNVVDRLSASRVCKLWRDLAFHESIWKTVMLANIRVTDWEKFGRHICKTRSTNIDFKKMIYDDDVWLTQFLNVTPLLFSVTQFEFQKVSASALEQIITEVAKNSFCQISSFVAQDVFYGGQGETHRKLDLKVFGKLKAMNKLKLRSIAGNLKIDNFGQSLSLFAEKFSNCIRILSLLNLDNLTNEHLSLITQMNNIDLLELGNCAAITSFKPLGELKNLTRLRLERGCIEDLGSVSRLENLELIDFELKVGFGKNFLRIQTLKKILLIPVYKDEVATINSEIVDMSGGLKNVTHFYLGMTNEWLEADCDAGKLDESGKISFGNVPVIVKGGKTEHFSLSRLSKLLVTSMPKATRVKILKMSKKSTIKQYLNNMKL